MSSQSILQSLTLVEPSTATQPQQEILEKAQKQAGHLPNMYKAMANAPALLGTYLHGYALFRSESGLSPAEQEVVFLAVSQVNHCHYCMAAHSMIADKRSGVPAATLEAIRAGRAIPDRRLAALHDLAKETALTHGQPGTAVLQAFRDAGYTDRDYLYVVLAIGVKTLSNFTNHAFDTPLDASFAAYRVD